VLPTAAVLAATKRVLHVGTMIESGGLANSHDVAFDGLMGRCPRRAGFFWFANPGRCPAMPWAGFLPPFRRVWLWAWRLNSHWFCMQALCATAVSETLSAGWCRLLSLRDPAGAEHAAGPPEGIRDLASSARPHLRFAAPSFGSALTVGTLTSSATGWGGELWRVLLRVGRSELWRVLLQADANRLWRCRRAQCAQ